MKKEIPRLGTPATVSAALEAETNRPKILFPPLPAEPIPRLFEATADESGGEITVKAVEADGTLVGDEITLKVMSGDSPEAGDRVIRAATEDGCAVAFCGSGSGGGGTPYKIVSAGSGGKYTVIKQSATGEDSFENADGASNVTALNLAEKGGSSELDAGDFVIVTKNNGYYFFDHSMGDSDDYAKYK